VNEEAIARAELQSQREKKSRKIYEMYLFLHEYYPSFSNDSTMKSSQIVAFKDSRNGD
jgi:hypothetical protein